MLSPMLLFTFITSLISAFQQLTIALLLTEGGPLKSTYFFAMYIYDNAFKIPRHGLCRRDELGDVPDHPRRLALTVLKYSAAWVHYEGEVKGGGKNG